MSLSYILEVSVDYSPTEMRELCLQACPEMRPSSHPGAQWLLAPGINSVDFSVPKRPTVELISEVYGFSPNGTVMFTLEDNVSDEDYEIGGRILSELPLWLLLTHSKAGVYYFDAGGVYYLWNEQRLVLNSDRHWTEEMLKSIPVPYEMAVLKDT